MGGSLATRVPRIVRRSRKRPAQATGSCSGRSSRGAISAASQWVRASASCTVAGRKPSASRILGAVVLARPAAPVVGEPGAGRHSDLLREMRHHRAGHVALVGWEAPVVLERLEQRGEAEARGPRLVGQQRHVVRQERPVFEEFVDPPQPLHRPAPAAPRQESAENRWYRHLSPSREYTYTAAAAQAGRERGEGPEPGAKSELYERRSIIGPMLLCGW